MRTTIRLDDSLLRRAKALAAASGRSLNDFISDAVRAALAPARATTSEIVLPTYPGGVLLPGVDLDDTASLLDLMDEPHAYVAARTAVKKVSEPAARPRKR